MCPRVMSWLHAGRHRDPVRTPLKLFLSLRRIESGERRVDVDDVLALALALDVTPNALLLPRQKGHEVPARVTGWLGDKPLNTHMLWDWAAGIRSLTKPNRQVAPGGPTEFRLRVRPEEVLSADEILAREALSRQLEESQLEDALAMARLRRAAGTEGDAASVEELEDELSRLRRRDVAEKDPHHEQDGAPRA